MLYKAPGPHFCDGAMVDHIIVADELDDETEAAGWFRSIPEALAAAESSKAAEAPEPVAEVPADDAPMTRGELEAAAKERNIPFNARTSDETLAERIAAFEKG